MGLANFTGIAMIAVMPLPRLAIAGYGSRGRTYPRLAAHLHPRRKNFMAFAAVSSLSHEGRRIPLSEVRG